MGGANSEFSILVINPNSSRSVTTGIEQGVGDLVNSIRMDITCTQIDQAPEAIETDAHISQIEPLIAQKVAGTIADAYVIACFSDPGVVALRRSGKTNIFGIAECAMLTAAGLPGRFGIISILPASVLRHARQVARVGLESRLAGDLPLNLGVLELDNPSLTKARLVEVGTKLCQEKGAESLILGCAGMAGYRTWLQDQLGVPVIDPCRAGVSLAAATTAILKA